MSDKSDFWAKNGAVLLHKRSRELYHVCRRMIDVDGDSDDYPEMYRYYRLQDDTHTVEQYWPEEDLVDCFQKTGEVVKGKPVNAQEMEYWYE